jgi:hypothetical protein
MIIKGIKKTGSNMDDALDNLVYDIRISVSYHRKREHFFRILDMTSRAIALIALASVGFSVQTFTIPAAIAGALSTIFSIALDWAGMASRHAELASEYGRLLSRALTANDVSVLRQQYQEIEAREPPQLRGLVQVCQDEQDASDGKSVPLKHLSMARRIGAQFGFGEREIDWSPPKPAA